MQSTLDGSGSGSVGGCCESKLVYLLTAFSNFVHGEVERDGLNLACAVPTSWRSSSILRNLSLVDLTSGRTSHVSTLVVTTKSRTKLLATTGILRSNCVSTYLALSEAQYHLQAHTAFRPLRKIHRSVRYESVVGATDCQEAVTQSSSSMLDSHHTYESTVVNGGNVQLGNTY